MSSAENPPFLFHTSPKHQSYRFGKSAHRALLVHGFTGTPYEMRYLGVELAASGWQATCDLLPGFGRNAADLADMRKADWLAAVRQSWRIGMADAEAHALIGFSMGGALATVLAAELNPDYLVLVAPFTRMATPLARLLPVVKLVMKTFKPFEKADFSHPAVRKQFRELDPSMNIDDPAVQARLRHEIGLPTVVLDEVRQLGRMAVRAAPTLTMPTLVIQGRDDDTVLPRDTRNFVSKLPQPTHYVEVTGGHDLPKQDGPQPYRFAHEVLRFLPAALPQKEHV